MENLPKTENVAPSERQGENVNLNDAALENGTDVSIEERGGRKGKKFNKVLAVFLSILIFLLAFAGGFFTNYLTRGRNANLAADIVTIMEKVGYIYDPVTGETREITEKDVADALVNAFLDEYSRYYTAEEYEKVLATSAGNYGGVGVSYYDKDNLVIDQVVFNSPFDRAGGKAGDKLVSGTLDGEEVIFTDVMQALSFIDKITLGEEFTLKYERNGEEFSAIIEKENYVAAYVYYFDDEYEYRFLSENGEAPKGEQHAFENSAITDASVGYIRLNGFEGGAADQMGAALNYMKSRGKTKLVLDLRDNGGGYMDVLCKIASYFIDNGGAKKSAVAISSGKTGSQIFYTDANRFSDFLNSMVIIGNDNTASASECLIGAIVYYKDLVDGISDVVVEENDDNIAKTYGKGIMQTTYQLISGGAFKLTTAKILWPDASTCIHGTGVTVELGATGAGFCEGLNKALQVIAA